MYVEIRKTLLKLVALLISLFFSAIAIELFLKINLGSDTLTVLLDGISQYFHVTSGRASQIMNILLVLGAIVLNRKEVGVMTIIYSLSLGIMIDLISDFIVIHPNQLVMGVKILILIIAQWLLSLSYCIMEKTNSGMHVTEIITWSITQATKTEYIYIRYGFDVLVVAVGFAMGGIIGIGTIIAVIVQGPLIKLSRYFLNYVYN